MTPSFRTFPNASQNSAVLVRLVLRDRRQQVEHAARDRAPDGLHFGILLQQLARHIERQVGGIDDALDEAQVQRQELLGVVQDENAFDVQPEPARRRAVIEIEWRLGRQVQERRVLAPAFDLVVAPGERIGGVVRDVAVELAVVGVRQVLPRPCPHRLRLIDAIVLALAAVRTQQHRERDVIGIAADQRAQPEWIGEFGGILLEVQRDGRSALLAPATFRA